MHSWLNYHHLRYFWAVARQGSVRRAAEELHLTQPAVSSQIKTLERRLGHPLFVRRGRRLELTETGRITLRYAEEIFELGQALQATLAGQSRDRLAPFRVGAVDALPKLLVHRLLRPAIDAAKGGRLAVFEDKLERLLPDLAAGEFDVVLADEPAPPSIHVKAYSHLVLESPVAVFAAARNAPSWKRGFPASMSRIPILLPTTNTALRRSLDSWFSARNLTPNVVAEIEDSAILNVFGQEGVGAFAAPVVIARELRRHFGVTKVGMLGSATERVYAITVERRIAHPGIRAMIDAGRSEK